MLLHFYRMAGGIRAGPDQEKSRVNTEEPFETSQESKT